MPVMVFLKRTFVQNARFIQLEGEIFKFQLFWNLIRNFDFGNTFYYLFGTTAISAYFGFEKKV